MCTATTYKTKDFYIGRTLDHSVSYGEKVVITPRNYSFKFVNKKIINFHYAIIGMAIIVDNYPLYYDAINEKGLGIAGLNFVGNAHYESFKEENDNITPFELIPWLLSQCATVKEVKKLLKKINLLNEPFNESLPLAELHWLVADKDEAITIEAVKDGIKVYDNPIGVLTNNPPFDKQMLNLSTIKLSNKSPKNTFSREKEREYYSLGRGAVGLPGDLTSQSRFVRVAFNKMNALSSDDEESSVNQFFHILNSVEQQRGCCMVDDDKYEITIYTSCCNGSKGIYYYTTYDNHQITSIDMFKENLNSHKLIEFPLIKGEQIKEQN